MADVNGRLRSLPVGSLVGIGPVTVDVSMTVQS
jgi:hypothetical protein